MSFSFKKLFPEDAARSAGSPSLALGQRGLDSGAQAPGSTDEPTPFDGGAQPAGSEGSVAPFRPAGTGAASVSTAPESAPNSPFAPAKSATVAGGSHAAPFAASVAGSPVSSINSAGSTSPFSPASAGSPPLMPSAASSVSPFQAATGGTIQDSSGMPVDPTPRSPEDMNDVQAESLAPTMSASPFMPSSKGAVAAVVGPKVGNAPPQIASSSAPPFSSPPVAGASTPAFTASTPDVSRGTAALDRGEIPTAPPSLVSFGLHSLLVGLSHDVLGFEPGRIPEDVKVELPAVGIVSQIPSGKVSIALGEIVSALQPQFRAAFAKGKMETPVKIPLQELYSAIPAASFGSQAPAELHADQVSGQVAETPKNPSPSPFSLPLGSQDTAANTVLATPAKPPFAPASSAATLASAPGSSPAPAPAPSPFASAPVAGASSEPSPPQSSASVQEPTPPATPIQPDAPSGSIADDQASVTPLGQENAEPSGERASLFGANLNLDDDVLKPLKWDPQAKSATLGSEDMGSSPPLKMPAAPTFDDEEESQPLDVLAAPAPVEKPLVPNVTTLAPRAATNRAPSKSSAAPGLAEEKKITPSAGKSQLPQLGKPVQPAVVHSPASPDDGQAVGRMAKVGKVEPAKPGAPAVGRIAKSPDFVLRALLSMNGTPTCENVVDHCMALDGVSECLVLRSGEVVPGSDKSGSAGALASVAEGAFEKVTSLVREMGISSADALTIQLDTGTLNFFVDDAACLAILQEGSHPLGPGVRERLTIISQQIGTIPLA